jgi:hypothetical protein
MTLTEDIIKYHVLKGKLQKDAFDVIKKVKHFKPQELRSILKEEYGHAIKAREQIYALVKDLKNKKIIENVKLDGKDLEGIYQVHSEVELNNVPHM